MLNIIFIFKIHQPYIIKKLSIFDIGTIDSVIDYDLSKAFIKEIEQNSYIPTFEILSKLNNKLKNDFKFSIAISGILIEQLKLFELDSINILKDLIQSKNVEIICTPYYQSLSSIFIDKKFVFLFEEELNLFFEFLKKFFQ